MTRVLAQDQNYGNDTTQVEAALKKHEAVVAEIEARVSTSYILISFANLKYIYIPVLTVQEIRVYGCFSQSIKFRIFLTSIRIGPKRQDIQ